MAKYKPKRRERELIRENKELKDCVSRITMDKDDLLRLLRDREYTIADRAAKIDRLNGSVVRANLRTGAFAILLVVSLAAHAFI